MINPIYDKLLPQAVLKLSAMETKATCDNCLRSRDHRFEYTYKAHLKCCTFWPMIPNYVIGQMIVNHQYSNWENQGFALPLAVIPDFDYQHRFYNRKSQDFGRREDLLCPYYSKEQSQCSIWPYRGSVCTTFYCRSDDGPKGLKFWSHLNDYFSYIEISLAEECLVQLDFSPRDISDQLAYLNKKDFSSKEKAQKKLTQSEIKKLWNGYENIKDFYIKCYNWTNQLDKKQVKALLGELGESLERKVVDASIKRSSN